MPLIRIRKSSEEWTLTLQFYYKICAVFFFFYWFIKKCYKPTYTSLALPVYHYMYFKLVSIPSPISSKNSACFELDTVIYCNLFLFWVLFIYRRGFGVVSRLVNYLILFLLCFGLMEFFTFLWKIYFVEFFKN
jgi:hypothetical protein